jgi:hypothetical protein
MMIFVLSKNGMTGELVFQIECQVCKVVFTQIVSHQEHAMMGTFSLKLVEGDLGQCWCQREAEERLERSLYEGIFPRPRMTAPVPTAAPVPAPATNNDERPDATIRFSLLDLDP